MKLRTQQTSAGKIPLCLVAIFCREAYYKTIKHLPKERIANRMIGFTLGFYGYNNKKDN